MTATIAALPRYRRGDEFASSLLHGLGIVLSIGGLAVLVASAWWLGHRRAPPFGWRKVVPDRRFVCVCVATIRR